MVQFTEAEKAVIETIVLFLEQEGLIQENNGIIESLAYKLKKSAEMMGLPEKFAELKASVGEHLDHAHAHLENWGDDVISTLSEML